MVSGDGEIAGLARECGAEVILETGPARGLDAAAGAVVAAAHGAPWLVCHADLPLIDVADLSACLDVVRRGRTVLAPSFDGGTNLLGGTGPFQFSYGPGSFHRHLTRAVDPEIVIRIGLTWDLDRAVDLKAMTRLPAGRWLGGMSVQRAAG